MTRDWYFNCQLIDLFLDLHQLIWGNESLTLGSVNLLPINTLRAFELDSYDKNTIRRKLIYIYPTLLERGIRGQMTLMNLGITNSFTVFLLLIFVNQIKYYKTKQ